MKPFFFLGAAGLIVFGLLLSSPGVKGQLPDKKGPFPGKGDFKGKGPFDGKGGGGPGFERPLAAEPRRGNPGASPNLTPADFKELVGHAKDFDANKDGKLGKTELPEMFASFFDRADSNRDGFLDQAEMTRVLSGTAATPATSAQPSSPTKESPRRP